jgi:hypothetical protein
MPTTFAHPAPPSRAQTPGQEQATAAAAGPAAQRLLRGRRDRASITQVTQASMAAVHVGLLRGRRDRASITPAPPSYPVLAAGAWR